MSVKYREYFPPSSLQDVYLNTCSRKHNALKRVDYETALVRLIQILYSTY